jgi:hypothetical protein
MPDGSPQVTQTWVDTDGVHILIDTVQGFQKVRNLGRRAGPGEAGGQDPARQDQRHGLSPRHFPLMV